MNLSSKVEIVYTLELTEAELYQLWYLSYKHEGGPSFPTGEEGYDGGVHPRVSEWVGCNTPLGQRFSRAESNGVTPLMALNDPAALD